jgi:hypothetical protein
VNRNSDRIPHGFQRGSVNGAYSKNAFRRGDFQIPNDGSHLQMGIFLAGEPLFPGERAPQGRIVLQREQNAYFTIPSTLSKQEKSHA